MVDLNEELINSLSELDEFYDDGEGNIEYDWKDIPMSFALSENFIRDHFEKLDKVALLQNQELRLQFLLDFIDHFEIDDIIKYQHIEDESFIALMKQYKDVNNIKEVQIEESPKEVIVSGIESINPLFSGNSQEIIDVVDSMVKIDKENDLDFNEVEVEDLDFNEEVENNEELFNPIIIETSLVEEETTTIENLSKVSLDEEVVEEVVEEELNVKNEDLVFSIEENIIQDLELEIKELNKNQLVYELVDNSKLYESFERHLRKLGVENNTKIENHLRKIYINKFKEMENNYKNSLKEINDILEKDLLS